MASREQRISAIVTDRGRNRRCWTCGGEMKPLRSGLFACEECREPHLDLARMFRKRAKRPQSALRIDAMPFWRLLRGMGVEAAAEWLRATFGPELDTPEGRSVVIAQLGVRGHLDRGQVMKAVLAAQAGPGSRWTTKADPEGAGKSGANTRAHSGTASTRAISCLAGCALCIGGLLAIGGWLAGGLMVAGVLSGIAAACALVDDETERRRAQR